MFADIAMMLFAHLGGTVKWWSVVFLEAFDFI